MSKTIDERVVEMRFDNRDFERNVSTTMSTLDKLKRSLRLDGASKSLENVGAAAKKCDMSGLSNGVQTVQAKFSAMEVMAVTALANITNSAVNAGKRIVSALTIDPVKTGFKEYETQINAVQTILANTQSKGTTLDDVNAALDELNKYADKTIYNFTEMTRNIGTFTAAGIDLDTSVNAIQGIANLAAISGSTSQQASTAMYQLSQALAAGTVKLMDWNSVVNAGMGGQVFQDALKETARVHGVAIDKMIEDEGSFRETLKSGWITSEILTETLQKFTLTTEGLTEEQIKANREMLKAKGYTDQQIDAIFELGRTSTDAATKVKTFTQLWDVLKEAAQSGWTQTWELIVGDFEEAKNLLTPISDALTGFINKISDARNKLLEGALGSKWDKLTEKINEAGVSTEDFSKAVKETAKENGIAIDDLIKKHGSLEAAFASGDLSASLIVDTLKKLAGSEKKAAESTEDMTKKLKYFQEVVDKVWKGDYKNGKERIDALTKAGYKYAEVQDLVNKTVDGHRLTLEDLSDVQLKSVGYTEEEIKKLRELADQAEKTGTPLHKLIEDINKPSGRVLLIESFKNILEAVLKPLKAVRDAWKEVFGEGNDKSDALYNLIEGFHELTEKMIISDEAAENFKKVFEGLFAVFQLVNGMVSKSMTSTFKLLQAVLGLFGTTIWDIIGTIGDYLVKFRDWVKEHTLYLNTIDKIAEILYAVIEGVRGFVSEFLKLDKVQKVLSDLKDAITNFFKNLGFLDGVEINFDGFIASIKNAFNEAIEWIRGLNESENLGKDLIEGLVNGIKAGVNSVVEAVMNLGVTMLNAIKDVLGIHSPSVEFFEIGKNAMAGLLNGLKDGALAVWNFIKTIGLKCVEIIQQIDFGALFAAAFGVGILLTIKKVADVMETVMAPLEGFGKMMSGLGSLFKDIGDRINPKKSKWEQICDGILKLSFAIGILAVSVKLLSTIDVKTTWAAIGAIAALAAIMTILAVATQKLDAVGSFGIKSASIMAIASSLLIIAFAMRTVASLNVNEMYTAAVGLGLIVTALVGVLYAIGKMIGPLTSLNISKVGSMLIKLSVALLLMVGVVKLASKLEISEIIRGGLAIAAMELLFAGMIAATRLAGAGVSKAGSMMLKMSVALLLMIGVVKLAAQLNISEISKGLAVVAGIELLFAAIIAVTKFAGQNAAKAGAMMLMMSSALIIAVGAVKLAAGISIGDVIKGTIAITLLGGLFAALSYISKFAGKNAAKAGAMLLMASASLLMITGALFILSEMDPKELYPALGVVTVLELLFMGLIAVSKYAADAKASLLMMTITIGILIAAVVGLSFIKPEKLEAATKAISAVLLSFAAIVAATKSLKGIKGLWKSLVPMVAVVALLGVIVAALSHFEVGGAIDAVKSISILMLAMSAALVIASKAGPFATKAVLALALMGLVVAELGVVLKLLQEFDVNPSIETASALSILLVSMSAALVLLGGVGLLGPAAFTGIAALMTLISGLGLVIGAIGALVDKFPMLETFIDKGIPILGKIGEGLGAFFGGIVDGFVDKASEGLATLGSRLSDFMNNAEPFFTAVSELDPSVGDNVKALSQAIMTLTAADFIQRVSSFGSNGSSFAQLGKDLSAFIENAQPFFEGIKYVNADTIKGVTSIGDMILEITAANVIDGLASWITGGTSLADFGKQLAEFGPHLKTYSDSINGVNIEAITGSTKAVKALAEISNEIPKMGGMAAFFSGENDMGEFGIQLVMFGRCLAMYSVAVTGLAIEPITASVEATKQLVSLAGSIPNFGGLVAFFTGDNDMQTFGLQIVAFGNCLKNYSMAVIGVDATAITNSVTAAKQLANLANAIPNFGGLASWFTGDSDMATFGTQIVAFGVAIRAYSNAVIGVDATAISNSVSAAKQLIGLIKSTSGLDTSGVAGFKMAVSSLATISINGVIEAFANAGPRLYSAGASMINSIQEGAISRVPSMTNVVTNASKLMVLTINYQQTAFYNAGVALMNRLTTGLTSRTAAISTSLKRTLTSAVVTIKGYYTEFYDAGKYVVEGLAQGISTNTFKAEAEAAAMAKAALEAAEEALGIESPSTEMKEVGKYTDEGLAIGIKEYAREVVNAAKNLGTDVVVNIGDGITKSKAAEEAMSKKVSNIVSAFKTAIEAAELDMTTADLEYKLWASGEGAGASESQQQQAQLETLQRKIESQKQIAGLAYQEWQKTLKVAGEGSKVERDAYHKYLQEQTELNNLMTEMNTIQSNLQSTNVDAFNEYMKIINDNKNLIEMGAITAEELDEVARRRSGYNGPLAVDTSDTVAKKEIKDAIENTGKAAAEVAENIVDGVKTIFASKGAECGASMSEGIMWGVESVVENAEITGEEGANAAESTKSSWKSAGAQLVAGFADGILSNMTTAIDAAVAMANAAANAASSTYSSSDSIMNTAQTSMVNMASYISDQDYTPTVRPVLDTNVIKKQFATISDKIMSRTMELASDASLTLNSVTNLTGLVDSIQNMNDESNNKVVNAVNALGQRVAALGNHIDGMSVQMDGGAVVGQITTKMDNSLGKVAAQKARA